MLNAQAEQAGKWLWGSYNYWSLSGEARHYIAAGQRLVLANRVRLGGIEGFGNVEANVPFYKRYFLGGASSLRGWGRFEVSPLSAPVPDRRPHDARRLAEVRVPVWGKLGAVAFVDYGNVWG